MKTIFKTMSDVAVLIVEWEALVSRNVGEFKQELERALLAGTRVLIDLSQVLFIDSAGCGALLQAQTQLREKGGRLGVCCVSPSVRALFDLVRLPRVLDVFPSQSEAVQALAMLHPEK